LVHGYTGSKEDWTYAAPRLIESFFVVSYDQRGHGESSKPQGSSHYSLDILASDLAGVIEALGFESCHLVGHSMGGVVVQRFLQRMGTSATTCVALSDTLHVGGRPSPLEEDIALVESGGMEAAWAARVARTPANPFFDAMPDVAEWLRRRFLEMSPDAFIAVGDALLDMPDTLPFLRTLDLPVLVTCGERDETTSPAANRAIAEAIPGGCYKEIAFAGHTPQVENVSAWLGAVVPFLARNGAVT
jgi:pimeloyl-ACP methyl ester carboxylesterase